PQAILEVLPESVARENIVLPLAINRTVLFVAVSDPADNDTLQKLQFILNRDIQPVLASREQIVEAINRHYGLTETEYVDSMLSEFTDTAIDFTAISSLSGACDGLCADEEDSEFELALEDTEEAGQIVSVVDQQPGRLVERQATIRYYHRMNPE